MSGAPVMRPLSEALGLTAHELVELVQLGDKLELMVARLISRERADSELIVDSQDADLLSQRLAGVAAFVAGLAQATPADAYADIGPASRTLTLTDQMRRLTGLGAEAAGPSGELMLFDD